jgi:hypothetical protein
MLNLFNHYFFYKGYFKSLVQYETDRKGVNMKEILCVLRISKLPLVPGHYRLSQPSTYFTISKASAAAMPTWLPLKEARLTVDSYAR